jgi:hypothetical protein
MRDEGLRIKYPSYDTGKDPLENPSSLLGESTYRVEKLEI